VRRSTCDFIRDIRVIRGQKHNRIFTTDCADNTDDSQTSQTGCSIPQRIQQRIHIFDFLHHAGRTNGTLKLAMSSEFSVTILAVANLPVLAGRLKKHRIPISLLHSS
jgi:hypothetical protein